jgi:hypothetical protein
MTRLASFGWIIGGKAGALTKNEKELQYTRPKRFIQESKNANAKV